VTLALLVLVGLWACDRPAPAPAPASDLPPLELDVSGKQADLPWLKPPGAPAAPAAPADPRVVADEAFNLAMQAHETGDVATARLALPEALRAYAALPSLDTDAGFHVAVLQLAAGDPAQSLAATEVVLAARPTHLLALGVGVRAAQAAGDPARARAYAARLLAAYDGEQGQVAEYEHHAVALPIYREEAAALIGG
jgi:hypothetical protein